MSDNGTKVASPHPLYGPLSATAELSRSHPFSDSLPCVEQFVSSVSETIPNAQSDYIETLVFLCLYGRRSEQTYNAFRTEVERLLLWSWLIKGVSVANLARTQLNDYIDFCMKTPISWVGTTRQRHFVEDKEGESRPNPDWRPFRVQATAYSARAKYINRLPSQSTLNRQFSALSVYFSHLVEEDYVAGNPVPAVKKHCSYLVNDAEPPKIMRLGDDHWRTLIDVVTKAADDDPVYERHLFTIVALKSLYLRVSELSDRPSWSPTMGHFFKDRGYLWLQVFGKGNKKRRVSIPEEFIPYLVRYRAYRGLPDMPVPGESHPLIHSFRGSRGLSSRQLTRLVEESFNMAVHHLAAQGRDQDAAELNAASSHWLRHTGASMDVATRPLKHVSDDLGHSSMATTDKSYVQSDIVERAQSGWSRKV